MFGKQKFVSESTKLLFLSNSKIKPALCNALIFKPDKDRRHLGKLLILLKLDEDNTENQEIARGLVDIIKEEYYRSPEKKAEESLEQGLVKTNEVLKELASLGKVSWVNRLHAIIASITESNIALAYTGAMTPILIRDGEANIIKGGPEPDRKSQPNKSFSGITSGSLKSHDFLVFTTSTLLEFFSAEKLIQILAQKSLEQAREYIHNLISEQIRTEETVASVFVHLKPQKESEPLKATLPLVSPEDQKTDEILESSESPQETDTTEEKDALENENYDSVRKRIQAKKRRHFPYAIFYALGGFAKIFLRGFVLIGKGISVHGFPLVKKIFRFQGLILRSLLKTIKAGFLKLTALFKNFRPTRAGAKKSTTQKKGSQPINLRPDHTLSQTESEPSLEEKHGKIKNKFSALLHKPKRTVARFFALPLKVKVLAVSLIVILAASLVSLSLWPATSKKTTHTVTPNFEEILQNAQNKRKEAMDAMIYKDEGQALTLLEEAEGLLKQVLGSETHRPQAQELQAEIQDQFDKINKTTKLEEPTLVADITLINPNLFLGALINLGDELYTLSTKDNVIFRLDLEKQEPIQLSPQFANIGSLTKGCAIDQEKNIVFVNESNEFVLFDLKSFEIDQISFQPAFSPNEIEDLAYYYNKIYTLNPGKNQIVKYERSISGLSKGMEWLKEETDISQGISLAIDGNIYVLTAEGKILKFHSGNSLPFQVPELKPPLTAPKNIFTNIEYKNLYIADPPNQRIIVLDKSDGHLVKQFVSDDFTNLIDVWAPRDEKQIFLLTDKKIWQVAMETE